MTDSQPRNPGAPQEAASGLYAFAECEVVDARNGGVLLIDRNSDAQALVAPPVAQSMRMCQVFRTLEDHARTLAAGIPELAGQEADVMNVLGMLRQTGLMTSAETVCARLNAAVPAPVDLPPTRVFIVTCDRPAALERLLESMLRAGGLTRHESLCVVDDSRDAGNAERNREAVRRFNLTSPRDMHYLGADEARQLMQGLIAALPGQEEGIRFLIDRERWARDKTHGLARNLCLLLSVGRRAIVMDDDVVCAAVHSPHREPGVYFGDRPREVEFYASQEDILARTAQADFDPLGGHAQCLGLGLGQALGRLSAAPLAPAALAGCSSTYLSLWDAHSPVLVTQSGSVGDPGTRHTDWLYTLEGESARRLAQYPGGVQGALQSRQYWMGQPRPLFTRMPVISQVTGLDNSALLPPYFPVFRGEDYLFGAMTEYLHPQSAVLEYDWCVPHFPLEQRRGEPEPPPLDGRGRINPARYVTDRTRYATGISPGRRLASLAQLAGELAESGDRDLLTLYRAEVAEFQGGEVARLAARLHDGMLRPPHWQGWLEDSAAALNRALQAPAALGDLADLAPGLDDGAILRTFRELAGGFTAALEGWAAIRDAAAELADLPPA